MLSTTRFNLNAQASFLPNLFFLRINLDFQELVHIKKFKYLCIIPLFMEQPTLEQITELSFDLSAMQPDVFSDDCTGCLLYPDYFTRARASKQLHAIKDDVTLPEHLRTAAEKALSERERINSVEAPIFDEASMGCVTYVAMLAVGVYGLIQYVS